MCYCVYNGNRIRCKVKIILSIIVVKQPSFWDNRIERETISIDEKKVNEISNFFFALFIHICVIVLRFFRLFTVNVRMFIDWVGSIISLSLIFFFMLLFFCTISMCLVFFLLLMVSRWIDFGRFWRCLLWNQCFEKVD